jgi:pimeloyl-ACP methyl ester carboxylesterase
VASFILIHGSWHGGWCFDDIKALLEAEGHEVIAPDLPAMGGDEASLRATSLDRWADFAVGLCEAASQKPVILVGHSRGGLVISQAAEKSPEAMDGLIYISAMMLPDGMSRVAFKALEEPNPAFDAIKSVVFDGAGSVANPERSGAVFAQLSPPEKVAAAMKRLVIEPLLPAATPVSISPERFGSLPRTYIECTADLTIPITSQRLMQQLVPGAKVISLNADHSPFLSRPVELVTAMTAVVQGD